MTTFAAPEPPLEGPTPLAEQDAISVSLTEWLRELIWTGQSTDPRSLQTEPGMSEIGGDCPRRLAYKIAKVPRSNFTHDPMASIVGRGIHLVMAESFRRLDAGSNRWMIEYPLVYEGIKGSADAYDRRRKLLIDWKSTAKSKLRNVRREGPPQQYIVQAQLYAAALKAMGEDVQRMALVYLARDGGLDELFVWTTTPDQDVVDTWVEHLARIKSDLSLHDDPADVAHKPSRLCGWCDHHQPTSTDISRACPGLGPTS